MSIFARYETAPCVLQDIIAYEPHDAASHYKDTSFFKNKCSHALVTQYDRSRIPELDERPDLGTVWKVAAVCRECRCHLSVVIAFGESVEHVLFPCPNREFPLHHFRRQLPSDEAAHVTPLNAPLRTVVPALKSKFGFLYSNPRTSFF